MSFDPSPDFDPSPAAAPPRARNLSGWAALILLLGFFFATQLHDYLGPSGRTTRTFNAYVDELRITTQIGEALRMAKFPSAPSNARSGEFIDQISRLKPYVAKSAQAAALYAAMRFEDGERVTEGLKVLESSAKPDEAAMAKIYEAPALTPDEARALIAKLDSSNFLDRLAITHAKAKADLPDPRAGLIAPEKAKTILVGLTATFVALLLGLVALIRIFTLSIGRRMPGHPVGTLSPAEADAFAMRAAQSFALFLGVSLLFGAVSTSALLTAFGVPLAIIGATARLYRKPVLAKTGSGLQEVGIRKGPVFKWIAWGALAALANGPILLGLNALGTQLFKSLPPAEHPISTKLAGPHSAAFLISIFFAASVEAPFFEEILFRGTILPALSGALKSPWWGAILSSILFAAIHPTGIPAWPALAAVGGMSAFLTYRTGSLVPSIAMHCFHNAATLALGLALS